MMTAYVGTQSMTRLQLRKQEKLSQDYFTGCVCMTNYAVKVAVCHPGALVTRHLSMYVTMVRNILVENIFGRIDYHGSYQKCFHCHVCGSKSYKKVVLSNLYPYTSITYTCTPIIMWALNHSSKLTFNGSSCSPTACS